MTGSGGRPGAGAASLDPPAGGTGRRVLATARFILAANLRSRLTRGGLLLGAAVMLLGPAAAVHRDLAWSHDAQLGFFGFLVMTVFTVRSGLAVQRSAGLDELLTHNFLPPASYGAALLISLVGAWLVLLGATFGGILLSGGSAGTAVWNSASWGARALLLMGFVPFVELVSTLRLPFFPAAMAYAALLVALTLVLPEQEAVALFVPVRTGDTAALGRLTVQALAGFAVTGTLFLGIMAAAGRRATTPRRSGPSGHGGAPPGGAPSPPR